MASIRAHWGSVRKFQDEFQEKATRLVSKEVILQFENMPLNMDLEEQTPLMIEVN
jgi:hypothetical protein